MIARLRLGLGDYREAERLLTAQSATIAWLPGPPASLRLASTTDYGRTLHLLGRPAVCVTRMQPLEVDARRQQRQLPVQAADFYSELGRCQRDQRNPRTARLLYQRSLELRRNTLDDTAGVVENLADLADLERDAGIPKRRYWASATHWRS